MKLNKFYAKTIPLVAERRFDQGLTRAQINLGQMTLDRWMALELEIQGSS
jgi:hypothetical protein